jgi:hypothetical protein
MLKPSFHIKVAGYISVYWIISIFTLFVGFFILLSNLDCLKKPERINPRLTPLRVPDSIEELKIEEDIVYETLKKINQAFTFKLT